MVNAWNITLGFPNLIDAATLSGGAWTAGLPRANLQNRLIKKVARTSTAALADTLFKMTFTGAQKVRCAALVNHNLSFSAQWRIRSFSDAGFTTLIYDSGFQYVWPFLYMPWDESAWEWELDEFWLGNYTAAQIAGYTITASYIFASQQVATYWQIEVSDATNAAGYVQIGRPFLGPYFQPAINYAADSSNGIQWETKTSVEESLDGTEFFEHREPYRVFTFNLPEMTKDEGFGGAFEIARQANLDQEVMVFPDPTDIGNGIRINFLGRLRKLNPLTRPYWDTTGMAFEIKELR